MDQKIINSILSSLTADAYALGAHWIYDEEQLKNLPIDWETLNDAQVMWHKGKVKGDFTHYGDQTLYLLEYMYENEGFDKKGFYTFWSENMSNYQGYIDGATRKALKSMDSKSNDLSISGRLAPLLINAETKDVFLNRVHDLVEITHNTDLSHLTSSFFAELLWDSIQGYDIAQNIQRLKEKYPDLRDWIDEAVKSKYNDTIESIRKFGPACDIDGGFRGVIHLLSLEDDIKTVMQKNAKAGGDSSARGMVAAMILGAQDEFILPADWMDGINTIDTIKSYLE